MSEQNPLTCVGRISGVFGVKGWVKISSFTEPQENLFDYNPWRIKKYGQWLNIEVERAQRHKGGWIARIVGVEDRTAAEAYKLLDIYVEQSQFSELEEGDYYWHELVGLRVLGQQGDDNNAELLDFGVVSELFETGANDVLVVKADKQSIDDQERLIPYVPEMYVKEIDMQARQIIVQWSKDD